MPQNTSIFPTKAIIDLNIPAGGGTGARLFNVDGVNCVGKNNDKFPFCVANEFIGYKFAKRLGLNVPNGQVRTYEDKPYFFSEVVNGDKFITSGIAHEPIRKHLRKPSDIPKIAALDIFILNRDRHLANFMVNGGSPYMDLIVYDHNLALLNTSVDVSHFSRKHSDPCTQFLRQEFFYLIKQTVSSIDGFSESRDLIEQLTDHEIEGIISEAVANETLPSNVSDFVAKTLINRRDSINEHIKYLYLTKLAP